MKRQRPASTPHFPVAEAHAKINLTLHITGQRGDGYHLLDSLVDFAEMHDLIEFDASETRQMTVTGPFAAGVPTGPENLIWRAVDLIAPGQALKVRLQKNLPHGAGIGSGSSDAAETLRALSMGLGVSMPSRGAMLTLGADVPVCAQTHPSHMQGIGEILADVPQLPELVVLLVNPGAHVPTGVVFGALETKDNPPMDPMDWADFDGFIDWCAAQRNDLQEPAIKVAPVIGQVLDSVAGLDGCKLARMSGSGATCFGLFSDLRAAMEGADTLQAEQPAWWVEAGYLGPS